MKDNVVQLHEGRHYMGNCDPLLDLDTHWQLLALQSDMVRHRDRTRDPEACVLVEKLGAIIERHEP